MSISSRISSMEEHVTNAYNGLQGLGADLTGIDKNIDNIAQVLDDIYDDLPKVTGSGTSITLDDTRKGRLESTLSGNTSQETTTGKNLLPNDTETKTRNGITITKNSDGTYTVNGTATSDVSEAICNSFIPMSGTWRMLGCPSGGSASTYMLSAYVGYWGEGSPNIDTGNGTNITYTGNVKVRFYIKSGITCNNLIFKPMLTTDTSTTINDFEPYTGGQASPNPDYPQPVNVVSGDNEIVIEGKNLLGYPTAFEETTKGVKVTQSKGVYTLSGTSDSSGSIMVEKTLNNSHTIKSGDYLHLGNSVALNNLAIVIVFSDGTNDSAGFIVENRIYNLANKVGKTIVALRIYCNTANVAISMQLKPMILNDIDTSTEFIEYNGNTYNIDLPVENLFDSENNVVASHNGITNTYNSNGSVTLSGQASSSYANVFNDVNGVLKKDETYTFSTIGTKSFAIGFRVYYTDNTYGDFNLSASATSIQIIPTKEVSKFRIYIFSMTSGTTYNSTLFFQLEKGTNYNTFTPYGTTPIELCKIGTYRDYFYKDSGKLYLHKEIGKVVLNGSENIAREPIQNNHYKFYLQNISNVDYGDINYIPKILCDKLIAIGRTTMYVNTQGISSSNGALQIYTDDTKDMTISEFRTWLGSNNFIVYYGLITPTTTEITYQPLIDQLNLLEKAMSKDGQTNISQVNNDLPFIISASALKEWQENTSLNSTLSMVNPLSLGNTLNTQEIENNTQPIEVDNIEPLEEEENEES